MTLPITIIGAGLSGLLTAYRLKKAGINVQIIEARARIGGRIYTEKGANEIPLEMGATWFGPQHPHVKELLEELKLPFFEQYMKGRVYFDNPSVASAQLIDIPAQPPSYRISGGTAALIGILAAELKEELILNEPIRKLNFEESEVVILTSTGNKFRSEKVICCLPPALLVDTLEFKPSLPEHFKTVAQNTHTWMQDAIKVGLVYSSSFWRDQRISGIFSNEGPVTEFYDHTDSSGSKFALCGFVHPAYRNLAQEDRKQRIVDQLKRLLGKEAENYLSYEERIWSYEEYTAGNLPIEMQPHQNSGHPVFAHPLYDGRLIVSGSETSPHFGGYMEGAIYAANTVAARLVEQHRSKN